MFFSKKKKRKRFLCLRILCFFGIKGNYSVPQTVMCNYLNILLSAKWTLVLDFAVICHV